eukprot:717925-Prymnesium_polylepis.1
MDVEVTVGARTRKCCCPIIPLNLRHERKARHFHACANGTLARFVVESGSAPYRGTHRWSACGRAQPPSAPPARRRCGEQS